MMKRHLFFTLLFAAIFTPAWAQDKAPKGPDLQTAQPDFFDPTKKVVEVYEFSTQWRGEAGFVQWHERSDNKTFPEVYLHGFRIGGTVDFMLPKHFSVQTGVLATLTFGRQEQHYRSMSAEYAQVEKLQNDITQLELTIPARVYYNVTLWRKLRMMFYTGPQLQVGLVSHAKVIDGLSYEVRDWAKTQGIPTEDYDRYAAKELYRTTIQWGLGGGLEWDRYRLTGGYEFGLNNLVRTPLIDTQKVNEWGWMVCFAYKF